MVSDRPDDIMVINETEARLNFKVKTCGSP